MATKDRITCHVLDTTLGKPARGVRVKLELTPPPPPPPFSPGSNLNPSNLSSTSNSTAHHGIPQPAAGSRVFESQTDEDGRIQVWLPYSSATSSGEVPVYTLEDVLGEVETQPAGQDGEAEGTTDSTNQKGSSRWTLRFDTATYFGGEDKTFFPEVTVVFTVQHGQRYHVPLLLAPFSYSTYRGS